MATYSMEFFWWWGEESIVVVEFAVRWEKGGRLLGRVVVSASRYVKSS